jgi:DEAD/DEAH box helicase domain-containing protein
MAVMKVTEASPWQDLLDQGREDELLVAVAREGARPGSMSSVPEDLPPALVQALGRGGVSELYLHQAEALEAARAGNVIVTTGTASGKSLSFNLPVLETLAGDPRARALYL